MKSMCQLVSLLFALAFVSGGCGGNETDMNEGKISAELRDRLKSVQFVSEELLEIGLGPDDKEVLGHWILVFEEDQVCWTHSDVASDCGPYEIDSAGHITATLPPNLTLEGSYDTVAGRLEWDGHLYYPFPEEDEQVGQREAPPDGPTAVLPTPNCGSTLF